MKETIVDAKEALLNAGVNVSYDPASIIIDAGIKGCENIMVCEGTDCFALKIIMAPGFVNTPDLPEVLKTLGHKCSLLIEQDFSYSMEISIDPLESDAAIVMLHMVKIVKNTNELEKAVHNLLNMPDAVLREILIYENPAIS